MMHDVFPRSLRPLDPPRPVRFYDLRKGKPERFASIFVSNPRVPTRTTDVFPVLVNSRPNVEFTVITPHEVRGDGEECT